MDFKGTIKIDFKEARENAGYSMPVVEAALNSLPGYKINLESVERNEAKLTSGQVESLMGIYGIPLEQKRDYYAKYTNI